MDPLAVAFAEDRASRDVHSIRVQIAAYKYDLAIDPHPFCDSRRNAASAFRGKDDG